jgi:hypothetical protein
MFIGSKRFDCKSAKKRSDCKSVQSDLKKVTRKNSWSVYLGTVPYTGINIERPSKD